MAFLSTSAGSAENGTPSSQSMVSTVLDDSSGCTPGITMSLRSAWVRWNSAMLVASMVKSSSAFMAASNSWTTATGSASADSSNTASSSAPSL